MIHSLMKNPIVFDTRNYFDKELLVNLGFEYYLLGEGERLIKANREAAAVIE